MKHTVFLLLCLLALLGSAAPVLAYTEVLYDFPLDSNPGWTATGGWTYTAGPGRCITSPHSGTNWYGWGVSYCYGLMGAETLTTTALDCSSANNVHLKFWRTLGLADPPDSVSVLVSNNGSTWTTVWASSTWYDEHTWTLCDYDISAVASGQSTVYVRWVMGPMNDDTCYCWGWNIDDVQITTEHPEAYYFPLNTDPGWSRDGAWAFGTPTGGGGLCGPSDPTAARTGSYVYGYNLAGDYGALASAEHLTTSALDCSAMAGTTLSFWRWLGVDSQSFSAYASVEVSNNGSTWTTVWDNSAGYVCDDTWQHCVYDISAVADGQSTVYVRWAIGPTNASYLFCGWNLDDISLTSGSATEILAWTLYTDWSTEYPNTLSALTSVYPNVAITETTTEDPSTLAAQLVGKHVFLVPEPENACYTTGALATDGAAFADVLRAFVAGGGTVIVCGEDDWACYSYGFLNATGLMDIETGSSYASGQSLPVLLSLHPLAAGLGSSVAAMNSTAAYQVNPDVYTVIGDGAGHAVVAAKQIGAGAVVAIGYDYYEYDASGAQVIANAVQYPRASKLILVYDDYVIHPAQEALARLSYPYQTCNETDYSTAIPSESWNLVLMNNPAYPLDDSYLAAYVGGGGYSAVCSWGLQSYPRTTLATAFGVTANESLVAPVPVYRWDTGDPLFNLPQSVPDLLTWNEIASYDADRLTASGVGAYAVAGFTASPASDQAAIVVGNGGRTVINGFLWDEGNQDANGNGIEDMVELVMNETQFLVSVPINVDFSADVTEMITGQTVNFTGSAERFVCCPVWGFDDGNQDYSSFTTSHAYGEVGFYTPALWAYNWQGPGTRAKRGYLAVGFPDADSTHWAFRQIIACQDAGVVAGYWDGYHPAETLNRAQMAVYVARALAGGDANVPPGPGTATFGDVPTDHWAFKYVEYAVAQAVVQGYWDGYHPDELVNRAQMAVYMARAVSPFAERPSLPSYTPPGTATFPDVATDHWAFKYVEYCYAAGIVTGYWDGYHPDESVNRGQMAVYVQRAFDYETYAP